MMTTRIRVRQWIIAICCFLFLLSSGITFVIFCEPLYAGAIQWFGLEKLTGFSAEILQRNYHELIRYLTQPWVSELVMPQFSSSPQGLFHFEEVKNLFMINFAVFLVSGGLSVVLLCRAYQERRLWMLLQPLRVLFLLPILVVVAIISFFDVVFVQFHQIFFHNSAWIFDPRLDPIITALPEEFFMLCFIIVFGWLLVSLFALYYWIGKQQELE